jgi:ATP-dependent DNA helicase RecG
MGDHPVEAEHAVQLNRRDLELLLLSRVVEVEAVDDGEVTIPSLRLRVDRVVEQILDLQVVQAEVAQEHLFLMVPADEVDPDEPLLTGERGVEGFRRYQLNTSVADPSDGEHVGPPLPYQIACLDSRQMDARAYLDADVVQVEGVTRKAAAMLSSSSFGIRTVRDLLEHYPHQDRYRDVGARVPLAQARLGEPATIVGQIARWSVLKPRRRSLVIVKATIHAEDGGKVDAPFFNQEWRPRQHPPGTRVAVSGILERFRGTLQLGNPKLVVLDGAVDQGAQTDEPFDRIQATYPATEALPSYRIAQYVRNALNELEPVTDFLPERLRRKHRLLSLDEALRTIHRPPAISAVRAARDRLVYDELLCLQVGLQRRRHRLESEAAGLVQPPNKGGLADRLLGVLPFEPTGAQRHAFAEIGADLARPKPMHRLLQGDVGAGKTLVAAWAMLVAADAGRQAVLMAPTSVLAEQHFRTLSSLLAPLGVNAVGGPRLGVLTGSTTTKQRRALLAELACGDLNLLIGTHALLEEQVAFFDLGLVVVDEQHRFGVEHRTRLRDKRVDRAAPDVLVMTATPIPRSLALTLYGDLDVTLLDELPPGRQEITTQVLASDSPRRARLYEFIRERVAAGERVYVVCPLIEESEALDVAAAEDVHARLSTGVFSDLGVGLVHGRLPAAERDARMDAFRRGEAPILVATTVIEVGVDVAEATIMVIEDADRFGISQLHQLRGRIGRGDRKSWCVLFSHDPQSNPRLQAVAATRDGFRLAETDLELRGEGSLFDTRQSGLPDLKLAKLIRDLDWVVASRTDARELVEADPGLDAHPALRDEVRRRYGDERLAALESG